jgi:C-terminal processing protease CtpA/Prc
MMNLNTTSGRYLFGLALVALLASCCDDDPSNNDNNRPEVERTATQEWIENTMREHYLWFDEIPQSSKLDYTLDDEQFFNSMLSLKDGIDRDGQHYYFSYLEKAKTTRNFIEADYSYGFEFTGLYVADKNDPTKQPIIAAILYVLPGSPAEEAGLQRGDWITALDGRSIDDDAFETLYGGAACSLTVGRKLLSLVAGIPSFGEELTMNLPSARPVDDNPVFLHTTLAANDGRKVGYLVYNEFEAGPIDKENDTQYDDELRDISKAFKAAGVSELVLDLRYNNGGLLSSGILLCSILEPADQLGKTLGYLEYNTKQSPRKRPFPTYLKDGSNLNLKRLFVLTSSTTASASEMVINCLDPLMEVVVIGETTVGKNVGSEEYKDDEEVWSMHPIVCKLTNSIDFGDYANGFEPTSGKQQHEMYTYNAEGKVSGIINLRPLGDKDERLLKEALNIINGNAATRADVPVVGSTLPLRPAGNSLARKATPGVVITP